MTPKKAPSGSAVSDVRHRDPDPATSIGQVGSSSGPRPVNLLFVDADIAAFLAMEAAVVKRAAASR